MLSREQLNLIFNHTNDLIFLLDVEGDGVYRCAAVNQRFLDASGLPAEHFTERLIEEIFPRLEVTYLKEQYARAIGNKHATSYETRTAFKGDTVYLETTLVPIFDDGRCTNLIGVSRDITLRKKTFEELLHAKRMAEQYLEVAEAVIVAADTRGYITMLNRKGYDLLGYPEGSLTGKKWSKVCVPEAAREGFDVGLAAFLRQERPEKAITYILSSTGARILMSWTSSIMRDDKGKILGILSSGEDITRRRQAEKSLMASQRVIAGGEIASGVAHDFNNALQAIMGNIELALMNDNLSEDVREALVISRDLSEDAAERVRVLQQNAVTGAGAGKQSYNLNELVAEAVMQTKPIWADEASRKGIQITVEQNLSPEVVVSTGNKGELRSVIYNLIKNGIESMPAGGKLTLSTRYEMGRNTFKIADEGVGMDEMTSTKIFQPFFTTKGFESGRGLGLSAAHSVISFHSGEISVVDSIEGRGTTIEFTLPALDGQLPLDIEPKAEIAIGDLNILWVDDDPQIRVIAEQYMQALGCKGDVAGSGLEALELLAGSRYSAVFTDIGMPGMSGFELAEQVKRVSNDHLTVVAITGWGHTLSQQDQTDNGVDLVMSKPIRLDQLRDVLQTVAQLRHSA